MAIEKNTAKEALASQMKCFNCLNTRFKLKDGAIKCTDNNYWLIRFANQKAFADHNETCDNTDQFKPKPQS